MLWIKAIAVMVCVIQLLHGAVLVAVWMRFRGTIPPPTWLVLWRAALHFAVGGSIAAAAFLGSRESTAAMLVVLAMVGFNYLGMPVVLRSHRPRG